MEVHAGNTEKVPQFCPYLSNTVYNHHHLSHVLSTLQIPAKGPAIVWTWLSAQRFIHWRPGPHCGSGRWYGTFKKWAGWEVPGSLEGGILVSWSKEL